MSRGMMRPSYVSQALLLVLFAAGFLLVVTARMPVGWSAINPGEWFGFIARVVVGLALVMVALVFQLQLVVGRGRR